MPIVLVVSGRLTPGDVPGLCDALDELLHGSAATEAICDVGALADADLTAVEAVARLRLTARRAGCRMRLRGAPQELLMLLELLGLGEVA